MGSRSSKVIISDNFGKEYICPTCNKTFPSTTSVKEINDHTINCAHNSIIMKTEPDLDNIDEEYPMKKYNTITSFSFKPKSKIYKSFDKKVQDWRKYINSIKISWTEGCDTLSVSRENTWSESIERIKCIDLLKELKIDFKGEVSYDAGGIIREWFMVIIQELERKDWNIFQKSDTDDFSFVPSNWLSATNENLEYFEFIGKLIAKAWLDNITINWCFNKIIYKMMVNEKVVFEDWKHIDKPWYLSISELKKMDPELLKDLSLYYIYEYNDWDGKLITEELIEGGQDILVEDIDDYTEKRIKFMIKKYKIYIDTIKLALFDIIPEKKFEDFNSYEFEWLINGKPFIDVKEWKDNSVYKGKYTHTHKVILWFWEALSKHTQEELSRFLQFCTGSSRVPLSGFSKLESNRGEIAKFCIQSVNYNSKGFNCIRAHTCFNRIDLPIFKTNEEVAKAIENVLNNEILGFGID